MSSKYTAEKERVRIWAELGLTSYAEVQQRFQDQAGQAPVSMGFRTALKFAPNYQCMQSKAVLTLATKMLVEVLNIRETPGVRLGLPGRN